MSYIICMSVHPGEHFQNQTDGVYYAPAKKNLDGVYSGSKVVLWLQGADRPDGIYGIGQMLSSPLKPSKITKGRELLIDAVQMQVAFKLDHCFWPRPFICREYAYLMPSFNIGSPYPLRIQAHTTLAYGYDAYNEVRQFLNYFSHQLGFYDDFPFGPFSYFLHTLREEPPNLQFFSKRYKWWGKPLACHRCGIDYEALLGRKNAEKIMELHDTAEISRVKYTPQNQSDKIPLCPTCHRITDLALLQKLQNNTYESDV